MNAAGGVRAFNGHVDLGTGIRTALAQIVAEELDVDFSAVEMELGNTGLGPDQGATIASETIQVTAVPLRQAAATARAHLLAKASTRLGAAAIASLRIDHGVITAADGASIAYRDLITGSATSIAIDASAPLKATADYRVVGRSQPRVDIGAKALGDWQYVHDVRVPGMLHGRVVRPPYAGFDAGPHVGASLISVDRDSVADVPGLVAVVVEGDFVGVVAAREEHAELAMNRLKVEWRAPPHISDLNTPEAATRANASAARTLADRGDVDASASATRDRLQRTYNWPYQMHGSIGPSCAVAEFGPQGLTVWSGTQNPFPLRRDLALLFDLPEDRISVERHEAAGCYGRNCADDVTADAALLSRAVGQPVRVQLTRAQEHTWEPKGAAQVIDVRGGLDNEGGPAFYDFETRYPSNAAPTLALLLTGRVPATPVALEMGDRTAVPPYAFDNLRVTVHDMPPLARASWFRGVSALPNTFAHESFIDELASAAKVDPIEYRLRYLSDHRAVELVKGLAERARWKPHMTFGTHGGNGDILYGRGFAYARYSHGKFPGTTAAWAAWIADVAVNRKTGDLAVTKVYTGQDSGQVINPDGVRHQIHGNVIQSTSRALLEQVRFSETGVASQEWGGYPILAFPQVPEVETWLVPRPDDPPLGVGESASVPSAAAIANALYDATGVRFRDLPLTPEKIRAALNPLPPPRVEKKRRRFAWLSVGVLAGAAAVFAALLPWRAAIPPAASLSGVYSAATIERGRLAAAAGACNVCHVGANGFAFAGGRPIETPFGTIYASNITPDPDAGIGNWTYPAFARAMREGVSRDGHYLYPAHPYPSFAKASEPDTEAIYAYLQTVAASPVPAPTTALPFPFGVRQLMAFWNLMFLRGSNTDPIEAKDAWLRGKELVEGLGHCGACHTPLNSFGAEKRGRSALTGGEAEHWLAPSLVAHDGVAVSWTKATLFAYLRTGYAPMRGIAAGPMADVIASMKPLPDADIEAMAEYLSTFWPAASVNAEATVAIAAADAASEVARERYPGGARIFETACASCHANPQDPRLPSLALSTAVHADRPNNVILAVLGGSGPASSEMNGPSLAAMPAFRGLLDESQLADLVAYVRARFAPGRVDWGDVGETISKVGAAP
jgi:nicotinate dehydrogenase subunit B